MSSVITAVIHNDECSIICSTTSSSCCSSVDDPDQVTPMNDPAAEACNQQLHTIAYVVLFVKRGACYDFRTIDEESEVIG